MNACDAHALLEAKREAREFYENFTAHLLRDRLRDNPRHRWIRRLLRDLFAHRRFGSALDVGCGIGLLTREIRRFVPEVRGVDLSENNIRFARATVPGVEFDRVDLSGATTTGTLPRRYELITAFDVLEHIPAPEKGIFLHRLMDHLTEDGWILLTIPTPEYLEYQRRHAPERLQVIDQSVTSLELSALLEGRMEIRECRTYGIDYLDQYKYYLLGFPEVNYRLRSPARSPWHVLGLVRGKLQWMYRSILYKKKYERIARGLAGR
jgi:SAM-dependent methyltransferase